MIEEKSEDLEQMISATNNETKEIFKKEILNMKIEIEREINQREQNKQNTGKLNIEKDTQSSQKDGQMIGEQINELFEKTIKEEIGKTEKKFNKLIQKIQDEYAQHIKETIEAAKT